MAKNKCIFQPSWLDDANYQQWLSEDSASKRSAACKVCKKTIDIGNMGVSALNSHANGKKHQERLRARYDGAGLINYFRSNSRPDEEPTTTVAHKAQSDSRASSSAVTSFISRNDSLKAEVMWTLKVVRSHFSYSSCQDVGILFATMFPDSEIAKQFSCGEKKCSYLACFGLSPYFKNLLVKDINAQNSFVLLMDESLNRTTKRKQMDIHARIWKDGKITTRYFTSAFMGHATAENILEHFTKSVEDLSLMKLIQISMDGPSVNWKFHHQLTKQLKTVWANTIVDIGSCGLHLVHSSVRDGMAACNWQIQKLLSSLYILFKDTPARREDYITVTNSDKFPLKFCGHRWIENVPVAERAVEIWPYVSKYVDQVVAGTIPSPQTTSFEVVRMWCKDPLVRAKLLCFISICKEVSTFLTQYQTDKPMIPFLSTDLHRIIQNLMKRFIKPEVLNGAKSLSQLLAVDLHDKENQAFKNNIKVGFETEAELTTLLRQTKISLKAEAEFRKDCLIFLETMTQKLLLKCPLKYNLVSHLSCLDPRNMAHSKESCEKKLNEILKFLCNAGRLDQKMCDDIQRQFSEFLDVTVTMEESKFKEFNPYTISEDEKSRVDVLLLNTMGEKPCYQLLWKHVVQNLLLLSHGQATVERGFSVNKEVEVENMHEITVIAHRIICDYVDSVGGLRNVNMSKELLVSAASARQKYIAYLDLQRRQKDKYKVLEKRKSFLEEIEELKKKKARVEADIAALMASADRLAEKAETTSSLTCIAKSNSMRRTALEKNQHLKEVTDLLNQKVDELKTC